MVHKKIKRKANFSGTFFPEFMNKDERGRRKKFENEKCVMMCHGGGWEAAYNKLGKFCFDSL